MPVTFTSVLQWPMDASWSSRSAAASSSHCTRRFGSSAGIRSPKSPAGNLCLIHGNLSGSSLWIPLHAALRLQRWCQVPQITCRMYSSDNDTSSVSPYVGNIVPSCPANIQVIVSTGTCPLGTAHAQNPATVLPVHAVVTCDIPWKALTCSAALTLQLSFVVSVKG